MDCVDCDQTSRRRLSPCLTRILNNVGRLCLAVCHALLSSDRLARHEAKSPSAPRSVRPSRLHSSALVGGCEVHAAGLAARDLQLQLRLEVHSPGRSRAEVAIVRRLAVGDCQHAAYASTMSIRSASSSTTAAAIAARTRESVGTASTSSCPPRPPAPRSSSSSRECARPATSI